MLSKLLKNKILLSFVFSIVLASNCLAKVSMSNFEDEEFEAFESSSQISIYDPFEKFNRKIFTFNEYADRYVTENIALFYRNALPKDARNIVRNFLTNITLPISLVNSLLQGKFDNSMATFSTFLINSSIGIAGIFDVAGEKSIRYQHEDFGQTLGFYGVGSGAYIMLPILGPSSTRDFCGMTFDKSINPLEFNFLAIGGEDNLFNPYLRMTLAALGGVDKRESLLDIISDIRKESFDPYATIRSAYLQKRFTDVKN